MKKVLIAILMALFIMPLAFADSNGSPDAMLGSETSKQVMQNDSTEVSDEESDAGRRTFTVQANEEVSLSETERVMEKIQLKKVELEEETDKVQVKAQVTVRNQNTVRLAVHALLEMEEIVGGIGKNVSAIAKEFNNSIEKTVQAEEKIQAKGAFARFFTGGDDKSAEDIENQVNKNMEKIQQLRQLRNECNCTADISMLLEDQIQSMEAEQTRLQALAQSEKQSKGIIGWIWK